MKAIIVQCEGRQTPFVVSIKLNPATYSVNPKHTGHAASFPSNIWHTRVVSALLGAIHCGWWLGTVYAPPYTLYSVPRGDVTYGVTWPVTRAHTINPLLLTHSLTNSLTHSIFNSSEETPSHYHPNPPHPLFASSSMRDSLNFYIFISSLDILFIHWCVFIYEPPGDAITPRI